MSEALYLCFWLWKVWSELNKQSWSLHSTGKPEFSDDPGKIGTGLWESASEMRRQEHHLSWPQSIIYILDRKKPPTNHCNYMNFLAELILVARCYPISISACVGNISDTCKHIARSHDEGYEDRAYSPRPTTLQNRCNVTKGQGEA